MTHKALTVGLLIFGLLLAALIAHSGSLALLALPFLTYWGAGVLAAPALEQIHLRGGRTLTATSTGQVTTIEAQVAICNEGAATLSLQLSDPVLPGMKVTGGDFRREGDRLYVWLALAGGEEAVARYTFETTRGSFRWQDVQALASDTFGLFAGEVPVAAGGQMQVQPQARKLPPVALRPESTLHAPGSIPARLAGSGIDFWGVREYHPGDALRRLDWRLAARHPREFFTREFEQEEVADIALILDARSIVGLQFGEDSLFERMVTATASLAETFLHQGHRVSLLVFSDEMRMVFPGYGKVQLNRILRKLAQVRPSGSAWSHSLDYLPLRLFSSRALLVILSPLVAGDVRMFARLRARGNQGLLICPNAIDFVAPGFPQDTASRLAVRAALVEHRLDLRRISEMHVRVIDWQVAQPLSPLVRAAFRPARGGLG